MFSSSRPTRQAPNIGRNDARPVTAAFSEIFKIGIGPSSSHTVGPMVAAGRFIHALAEEKVERVTATAYGSLAWTGKGHATDQALILGLAGFRPDTIEPDQVAILLAGISAEARLRLPGGKTIVFRPETDVIFDKKVRHARHPNALRFLALDAGNDVVADEMFYSIGGGLVVRDDDDPSPLETKPLPFMFFDADSLLEHCEKSQASIADIVLANELTGLSQETVFGQIDRVIDVMMACIDRGLSQSGTLPGGLKVDRRAKALHERLFQEDEEESHHPAQRSMEFVSSFAIAVNEENAAGGRVVTAPTNGAAGVVPAVLRYYRDFCKSASREGMRTFMLTATAIGGLIKGNASISGAEVGCQGEVGSASSMAAAGLAAALGATARQTENAAEIAMEHHLGMTCDPIGGLVQIPCIERNAFGAIKAINAAMLALRGDGTHHVSLDQVITTMWQTGRDMKTKYKETSRGGLAINVPNC